VLAVTGPLLTDNELAVLRGCAAGETNSETAQRLHFNVKAVEKINTRVFRKLGANNAPHAVLLACQAGILDGRPQRHGDHAGYAAHWYRGEDPCDACRRGERVYRNSRRTRMPSTAAGP
jgi:DNA-binding CsgD family transcriptional regulator